VNFSKLKILVIGDVMIDSFIYTESYRMSPEDSSVPVLTPNQKFFTLGGAANVAANLKNLGANVDLVSIIGSDIFGQSFLNMLKVKGISTKKILESNLVKTTLKERVFLNTKQIYRLDYEQNLNDSFSKLIIKQIKKISKDYDSVILSDYNKGVLNKDTISFIIKYFDCPVIVDPKKNDFSIYQNATALTPNLTELEKATSSSLRSNKSIEKVCNSLLHDFNLKFIVLTRGEKGISLISKDGIKHIKAFPIEKPDVTGAGDSVISTLTLTYALDRDEVFATKIANLAGSISVSKTGTSTVSINELLEKAKRNKVKI
jgi:rfaE bifunctional protein kinase chain/domain